MARNPSPERDQERRETVERRHQLRDVEEDYDLAKSRATSPEELQRLMDEMFAFRSQHRAEDIKRGKRHDGPGIGIVMQQNMWARWIEIAYEHQERASAFHQRICAGENLLVDELRESFVTFAAAASTVEALYEDTKYLIPERRAKAAAAKTFADGLAVAFGLAESDRQALIRDLSYLFDRRNESLHGYTEPTPPEMHPAGLMTGSEASRFNGPESRHALDIALQVLGFAEHPPNPANRWVSRWVTDRAAYHEQVVGPIRRTLEQRDAG